MKDVLNDWEQPLDNSKMKEAKEYNLDNLYKHAHSELSLQQTKRDQAFSKVFSKAWFLHVYYEPKTNIHANLNTKV